MKKHLFVKAAWGLALAFGLATTVAAPAEAQVKVILDTDMDLDVDDAGALAVLHALADNGEAEILGVILDAPSQRNGNARLGTATISAINTYYGRAGIPIGDLPPSEYMNNPPNYQRYRNYGNGFGDPGDPNTNDYVYYNEAIKSQFPNGNVASVYDSKALYRKLLAGAPDNSVTVIGVGLFRALNDLMYTTSADGYSSLTGKQLIAKKVKRLVLMTGESRFDGDYHYSSGFNSTFEGLGDAARVYNEWPTPIVIMPLGGDIKTGARLSSETPTSNPVRKAYELFLEQKGSSNRSSWDQLAVLYGVRGASNVFNEKTGRNIEGEWVGGSDPLKYRWDPVVSSDKPDILLSQKSTMTDDALEIIVEDLMVQGPKPKYAGELEAESAKLSGVTYSKVNSGFTGTGYGNYNNIDTDYVEWTVRSGVSGQVNLKFRYANGYSDNRPLKLTVNGTVVDSTLDFDPTGSWTNWDTTSGRKADFNNGLNTVRLTATGVKGVNLDHMRFEVLQSDTLQAEDAFLSGTTVSSVNAGYAGSGYAKYNSGIGNYVEWTIDKANASSTKLVFRYANGYSGNRPLKLTVNGTVIDSSLAFVSTGGWTTWNYRDDVFVNLKVGINKIRLTAIAEENCLMDSLWFKSEPGSNPNYSPFAQSAPSAMTSAPLSAGSS